MNRNPKSAFELAEIAERVIMRPKRLDAPFHDFGRALDEPFESENSADMPAFLIAKAANDPKLLSRFDRALTPKFREAALALRAVVHGRG